MTGPQPWSQPQAAGERVEVALGSRGNVLWIVACLLFAVSGLSLGLGDQREAPMRALGWVLLVAALAVMVLPVRSLLDKTPALAVDDEGIHLPRTPMTVPWSEVSATNAFTPRGGNVQLRLVTSQRVREEFYAEHRGWALARHANRALSAGVDYLPLPAPLATDTRALAAWLDREIRKRNPGRP